MSLSALPSVDRLLSSDAGSRLVSQYGHRQVTAIIRQVLDGIRQAARQSGTNPPAEPEIIELIGQRLSTANRQSLRQVINLTGTVLHTNLGRSPLPPEAIAQIVKVASGPSNLEFDLATGRRGDRDSHISALLTEITGAEAATVVNNNAAAVLLVLNTLALGKQVPVSRGELVEIGGSFRIPEIMTRAGCRLVEVGTTNRTHLTDYVDALCSDTALVMKVHTSNYEIRGFTRSVGEAELATITRQHGLPLVTDLGSGTLVDLTRYGLPEEPTVQSALAAGVDLVTFSGDKLLGGPQAGMIVGRRDLIDQINRNPLKRALRVDKLTIAALFEVLKLYRDPDSLAETLPALRYLARTPETILDIAGAVSRALAQQLGSHASVTIEAVESQVGSGALPLNTLPGYAIAIEPAGGSDESLQQLAAAFRGLPTPVIGRIQDGRLLLDLRTLEDPRQLIDQLQELVP